MPDLCRRKERLPRSPRRRRYVLDPRHAALLRLPEPLWTACRFAQRRPSRARQVLERGPDILVPGPRSHRRLLRRRGTLPHTRRGDARRTPLSLGSIFFHRVGCVCAGRRERRSLGSRTGRSRLCRTASARATTTTGTTLGAKRGYRRRAIKGPDEGERGLWGVPSIQGSTLDGFGRERCRLILRLTPCLTSVSFSVLVFYRELPLVASTWEGDGANDTFVTGSAAAAAGAAGATAAAGGAAMSATATAAAAALGGGGSSATSAGGAPDSARLDRQSSTRATFSMRLKNSLSSKRCEGANHSAQNTPRTQGWGKRAACRSVCAHQLTLLSSFFPSVFFLLWMQGIDQEPVWRRVHDARGRWRRQPGRVAGRHEPDAVQLGHVCGQWRGRRAQHDERDPGARALAQLH